ncbi:hypothetical protein G4177_13080 [Corallococcus sp. ZKHCc1 1396]|uniref:Ig-like domain-containing protein n=1 Tax=Corallococcus soli TaxID=2710757 RepID=A0ABR9PME0_9BACT|nr:hypothetical protein [Corallococcus soli]MBE4749096.1 hypothetical protein [Corallococcus soli]
MRSHLKRRPSFLSRLVVSAISGFFLGGAVLAHASDSVRTSKEEAPAPSTVSSEQLPSLYPTLVTCLFGDLTTTYTPGITHTPRTSTVSTTGRFSCLTLAGEPVSSATVSTVSPPVTLSCNNPLSEGAAQATLTWSTGETSVLSLNEQKVEVQDATTVQTFSSVVTSGKYAGANVVRTVKYLTADLTANCASPIGLARTHGIATTMAVLKSY